MIRLLSHSEISRAQDCEFQWAFAYGGQLTDGDALRPKTTAPLLREGRAWGRAVAAYQSNVLRSDALPLGHDALDESLDEDAEAQREAGTYLDQEHEEMAERLHAMLDHYAADSEPLPIERLEHELVVSLPSRRNAARASSRYRFQCFFDGLHVDEQGRTWIYEAKLRRRLSSFEQLALSRQARLYAWAYRAATGTEITGVIFDERLNEVPRPVAFNKNGSPSRRQNCTPDAYEAACRELDVEVDAEVLAGLQSKPWASRHWLVLRPDELDDTARQLISASQHVAELDSGARWPVRNPSPMRCPGCAFREICAAPGERDLVDALFDRQPPKRDREEVPVAA